MRGPQAVAAATSIVAGGLRQRAGKILPGAVVGNEHRQPGQVGQAVGMVIEQGADDDMRKRAVAGVFQAAQRSRYCSLSLTWAQSSASGSGSLLSMMTFHSLASWAFSAM